MKGKKFFNLEAKGEIFVVTLQTHVHGFQRGDLLICRKVNKPLPGMIVILERYNCGRWPMRFDEAGPELDAGARVIGQALSLSRDLDREVAR